MDIHVNEKFLLAEKGIDAGYNILILGVAGTGKSTFLYYMNKKFESQGKTAVYLAPTGIASINMAQRTGSAQTLHSYFKIPVGGGLTADSIKVVPQEQAEVYKAVDVVVIDEISMCRSDVLNYVDLFLRYNTENFEPFGGKQVILLGDVLQLAPVVATPEEKLFLTHTFKGEWFWNAPGFKAGKFKLVQFTKKYRQDEDSKFAEYLDKIRTGSISDSELSDLNSIIVSLPDPTAITLCTTNATADRINQAGLNLVDSPLYESIGKINNITGDKIDWNAFPVDYKFQYKVGCKVMIRKNGEGYSNGSIGTITRVNKGVIYVDLDDGSGVVDISPVDFELKAYAYSDGKISSITTAIMTQYPLTLAYGISIHKSQGLTFNTLNVNTGSGFFACGQAYVALSRCRSAEGIHLDVPLSRDSILVNKSALALVNNRQ